MALVKYGELDKRLKKHVRASVKSAKLAKYAYAFVVDGACMAVLLYDRCEYEVVHCEPESFAPMVRAIDELQAALESRHFVVRPAKSEARCLFEPGVYAAAEPTGDLMACEGAEGTFFVRRADGPRGFFGGPPVPVEAGIRLLWDRAAPAWRATMLHASRDKATGDVTVAFDPHVVRWCRDRESTDDRSLTLRPAHAAAGGGEVLLGDSESGRGRTYCRVNKLMYHGRADAGLVATYELNAFDVKYERMHVAYLASATVCVARLEDDVYADEARALLKAVGRIDKVRNRAARVIGAAWRRAVACPEYKVCRDRLRREFEGMR